MGTVFYVILQIHTTCGGKMVGVARSSDCRAVLSLSVILKVSLPVARMKVSVETLNTTANASLVLTIGKVRHKLVMIKRHNKIADYQKTQQNW